MVSALALGVTACDDDVIFEGLREDLRSPAYDVDDPRAVATAEAAAQTPQVVENRSQPVSLGAMQNVASWTHRGNNPGHLLPHGSLSAQPQIVWAAKAGSGNDTRGRITAEPVAANGIIYTMDSAAVVTATSLSGATVWTRALTPSAETAGRGSGGGLALGGGKLFVTTEFGELIAIDPATGAEAWRQATRAPLTGAPTVSNGLVFITSTNSEAMAVRADTGRIAWELAGTSTHSGVAGVAAPAISGSNVILPLANGSLLAANASDGELKWVARISGGRPARGSGALQAFTGEPVVAGGTTYVATPAGKAGAVDASGKVRWTATEGAKGMMAVAGGSLFFVSDELKLVRLSAASGDKIWAVDLPRYTREAPKRYLEIYPSYGPVLAGGRLWVASADGFLRGFNPADGSLTATVELPEGAASRPITVGGMLFVMTDAGTLLALR